MNMNIDIEKLRQERKEDNIAMNRSLIRSGSRAKENHLAALEYGNKIRKNNGNLVLERRRILRGSISKKRMRQLEMSFSQSVGVDHVSQFLSGFVDTTGSGALITSDDIRDNLFYACGATEFEVAELLFKLIKENKIDLKGIWVDSDDGHIILNLFYRAGSIK